jgi:hypothetical protein
MELLMKRTYFIKHDQRVRRIIGCDRTTLIFDRLEFYSSRQPDGFYKFIEPNSHKLYKKEESWTELLGCHRTSFWRAFKLIGKKHVSRWAFDASEDKFEGKLYASYYDRNTNRTFFIRNHDAIKEFFSKIQFGPELADKTKKIKDNTQSYLEFNQDKSSLRTEQNARSYIETKKTSFELFNNNSQASNDIVNKMLELWTALVEQGKNKIELTNKRIAFLKKAFTDKFENSLDKWKIYCEKIASSKFLMGEVKSHFRATLDWALKFEVIQKILEGCYGVVDRTSSFDSLRSQAYQNNLKKELAVEEEDINKLQGELEKVKAFRLKWLHKFGAKNYRESLKDCGIEVRDDVTLLIKPSSRYTAKSVASYWTPKLLEDSSFKRVNIFQQEGALVFSKWFGEEQDNGEDPAYNGSNELEIAEKLAPEPVFKVPSKTFGFAKENQEETPEEPKAPEEKGGDKVVLVTQETKMLRKKLRKSVSPQKFPSWLGDIEVECIDQNGMIVVTLKDQLTADWCRSRYSQEVFQSVKNLWSGVSKLLIREKLSHSVSSSLPISAKDSEKDLRNVHAKSPFEQAIQSLLSSIKGEEVAISAQL